MLTVLALSTLTHARIGETVAQCNARYGEVVAEDEAVGRCYQKSGFNVFVTIAENGKCGQITYSKENGGKFTAPELKALMRANGKGWVEQGKIADMQIWKTDDKAAYFNEGNYLFIRTLAYKAEEEAEAERKEAEKLKAF